MLSVSSLSYHTCEMPVEHVHTQPTLDAFFANVAATPQRALLLDYDGTLAPFRAERDQAAPYPGIRDLLHPLLAIGRTRVVIISGRAIAELSYLLGIAPLPELWGCHGWERRWPDGSYTAPQQSAAFRAGLEVAIWAAADRGLMQALEHKPAGLALHWRGLTPRAAQALRIEVAQAWEPIAARYGLQLHPFDGGLELRMPGRNKGTAVQTLLDEIGPRAALAYLGDDLTDEDAFTTIGSRGLRVLVRTERRPSAADLWLRPPEELLAFLERWLAVDALSPDAAP